jgi:hypothetical protein
MEINLEDYTTPISEEALEESLENLNMLLAY